ncbi:hypothetical protein [Aureliella helgolandensis]|uniref:hypothetical protein n=1 Tax=Aureliella helgolandensis TaxID=2527968 RepID=UPI0011A7F35C|nr:hypothetical protein [Aureliella helgolandensis]
MADTTKLVRLHFETNRALDFLSRKELVAQTGHQVAEWPLVCLKELVDNALDACEEAGVPPRIQVCVDESGLTISDNGPGLPPSVVDSVLDFNVRVSSREAYVSPCRGSQGNALKTVVAMPFALCGEGSVVIQSQGVQHEIRVTVDRVRQEPKIDHQLGDSPITEGTVVSVQWPDSARLILEHSKARFLQIAEDYCWLNPHLSLSVDWEGERVDLEASAPSWNKWLPSNPTDPHWYGVDELERLIAANICHRDRLVREFIAEFRGLTGSAKQRKVLEAVGLSRTLLSELVADDCIDRGLVGRLLTAMKSEAKPVRPAALGIVGEHHLQSRCALAGGDPESFAYKKVVGTDDGIPWVIETCFAYCPEETRPRRIITGVNWSPAIINPFRQLGAYGKSLDSVLEEQRAGRDEPTVVVLHISCPKVQYSDRGKSSVIVEE